MFTLQNKKAGLAQVLAVIILLAVSIGSYIAIERTARQEGSIYSYITKPLPRSPAPSPAPAPIGTGIYGKVTTEIVKGPTGRIVPFTGEVIVKSYVTKQEVKRLTPKADGSFSISIGADSYYLVPAGGLATWAESYHKVITVAASNYTYAEVFFASA